MKLDIISSLTELCSVPGPAGFEEQVAECAKSMLEPFMDEVWTDVLGNVIGVRRCGKENAPKLLFDAHIDEIGFVVTGVEEGFLRFSRLGGFDERVIPATGVMVCTDPPLYGVISVLPPHIIKKKDAEKNFEIENLYIDVGLSQEEASRLVVPGTHGVFANEAKRFGESMFYGKAIDDRAGFVAILRALELLKDATLDVDIYVMGSVQEEVGVRGATTGAYSIAPDYCVVVDVDHAKTPDTKPTETNIGLGDGAIISRGPNMNPKLVEKIIDLAKEKDIKHQINVVATGSSGTNARAIQVSRGGVATALLGLPMKYMHSAYEVISLDDIEYIAQLLCETAKAMKGETA
ncbi:MAG: M20/M25/M40 family metallo-hydrolase [Oscillospiraceae bacterium]|nr:M20/M25/M40 family metallo-hydrolase [Oscillospiraceae bacterium]